MPIRYNNEFVAFISQKGNPQLFCTLRFFFISEGNVKMFQEQIILGE
jgi:hypothetical protein